MTNENELLENALNVCKDENFLTYFREKEQAGAFKSEDDVKKFLITAFAWMATKKKALENGWFDIEKAKEMKLI